MGRFSMLRSDEDHISISIVTPNWNGRDFIEPCLNSVLDQDYPSLEYIVVDGASTDGSGQLIENYRSELAAYICEPDDGHADALNKGFAASSGRIMGWINSDDMLHPGTLHYINQLFLARPDIAWITGRPTSMNEDGMPCWMGAARPWSRLRFLAGDCEWIQQESTFWRRSLWEEAGSRLDPRLSVANDFELWTRFFRHAELHTVDRHLGCFRVRTGQRSVAQRELYEAEAEAVLQAEIDSLSPRYRSAFRSLLPQKARRLKAQDVAALEARLSICDPPVIRARTPRQAARLTIATPPPGEEPGLARAGAPSDLRGIAGVHKGKQVFVLTSEVEKAGPETLAALKGETVVSGPAVFLAWPGAASPAYLCAIGDPNLDEHASALETALEVAPQTAAFFPVWLEGEGDEAVAVRTLVTDRPGRFFVNPGEDIPFDGDVDLQLLRLAVFLGAADIIVVGRPSGLHAAGSSWPALAQAVAAGSGGTVRFAAPVGRPPVTEDGRTELSLASLLGNDVLAERLRAARQNAIPRLERLRSRILAASGTGRLSAAAASAWRNRRFLVPLAAMTAAGSVAAAFLPGTLERLALLGALGLAASFAAVIAVAMKTRRLFYHQYAQLAALQEREVARDIRLINLENQLEAVRSRPTGVDKPRGVA